jgi:hypothetical protein
MTKKVVFSLFTRREDEEDDLLSLIQGLQAVYG